MAVSMGGGGKAGQGLPGAFRALSIAAARELASDDNAMHGAFRPFIVGAAAGIVEQREDSLPPLGQTVGHPLFTGVRSGRQDGGIGPSIEVPADTGKRRRRRTCAIYLS